MKKDAIKIALLLLVLIIPYALIISESDKKPLLTRIEKEGYSKQPKDSLWEYVKYEFSNERIDLSTNYKQKYTDPILITLEDATSHDSLVVNEIIQELKKSFPLKHVSYYRAYSDEPFIRKKDHNFEWKKIDQNLDELFSYTTILSFTNPSESNGTGSGTFHLDDLTDKKINSRTNTWNTYVLQNTLHFSFPDKISIADKKAFIKQHLFDSMWDTHTINIENPEPSYRIELDHYFSKNGNASSRLTHTDYLADNEFLIKKIFSDDFAKQFDNYMYRTYPSRYAKLFLDRDGAKQNATALVTFLGLLILILACSIFWNRKFKDVFWNYFWAIFIYHAGFFSLVGLYKYLIDIEYSTNAVAGLLLSSLSNVLIIMVISFLFWQAEKRMVPKQVSFGYQLLVKLGLTFIFLYSPYILKLFFSKTIIASGGEINRSLNDLQFSLITISLALARGVLIFLNHFSESLVKEKDVELSRLKEINAQSELKLLQSHINPHFLYNALNSIAGLAHTNADKTEKMALSLSDLFRYSINKKGEKMSTIKEEVTMVENYLDIEKIRFGDRLTFQLDIDKSILDKKIPMYILQPLVENAIKHGISKIRGEAKIALQIIKEENNLFIRVSDNGPDFPKSLISGHGLQTVNDLLRLSYGDNASLTWENAPKKTITINSPLNH